MATESSSAIHHSPTGLSNEKLHSSRGRIVHSMKRKLSTFFSPTSPPKMVLGVASEEEAELSLSDEDEETTPSSLPPQPHTLVPPSLHRVRSGVVNCSQSDSSPASPRRIRSGASNTTVSSNSDSSYGPTHRGRSGVVNCSPPGFSSSQRLRSGVVNCSDASPSSQRMRSGMANCCGAEVTANLLGARAGKHISLAHSDLHESAAAAATVAHLSTESHPKMSLPSDFSPASVLLARKTSFQEFDSDEEDGSAIVHPESIQSDVANCEGLDGDSVSGEECTRESPSPVVSRESSSGETSEAIHMKLKGSSCSNLPDRLTEDTDWRGSTSSNLSETCLPLHVRRPTPATLFTAEQDFRKLSDPAASLRREWVRYCRTGRKQRCLSDSEAPDMSRIGNCEDDEFRSEEGGSSAQGYDSGYHDDVRSKAQDSVWSHSPALSESDGGHDYGRTSWARKTTPFSSKQTELELDTPLAVTQRAKRSLTRSSVGGTSSLGASSFGASSESHSHSQSQSMSSLWECQSPETVTDILSSLGFDDFEAPQLIPDRFIPKDMEQAKPSVMKIQALLPNMPSYQDSFDVEPTEPVEPVEEFQPHSKSQEPLDLPLGATAETFLSHKPVRPMSPPPPLQPPTSPQPPPPKPIPSSPSPLFTSHNTLVYTDQNLSHFYRSKALEPVPEETASDLSPSPRWFSPRVSIDHSVVDIADKLGANLAAKARKRSLPQRDGYKLSLGSQVESEPDSIYFSVTSYDDEVAREKEREKEEVSVPLPFPTEDFAQRRRRRGVYTPPPGLMNWLSAQQPISEEDCQDLDPDELPWPFNEEVRLRKSLSEIQQAQQSSISEVTPTDDTQSSHSSPDNGQTQRCQSHPSPVEAAAPSSPSRPHSSPLRHSSPISESHTTADDLPPQSPNMEVSINSNSSNNNEDSKASPKHPGLLHPDRQTNSHRELDSRLLPSSTVRHKELALTGHELCISLASPEQQMCRELDSCHLMRLPEVAAPS